MEIKIYCYDSNWLEKGIIQNIKNIENLQFNETINGWQWNFDIELNEKHDNFFYTVWDFIEYVIFDEKYKNWIHKYTWVIKWIEREIWITESITLKIEGLISLLSDYDFARSYSWTLTSVIDSFISDFHSFKNFDNVLSTWDDYPSTTWDWMGTLTWDDLNWWTNSWMIYLWNNILKNWVASTENINITTSWSFLNAIQNIFWDTRDFFIDKTWTIKLISEITTNQIFTVWKNTNQINIDMDWKINLDLLDFDYSAEVWQNIILQNINSNLNLSWKKINEIAFSLEKLKINAWKIINYK